MSREHESTESSVRYPVSEKKIKKHAFINLVRGVFRLTDRRSKDAPEKEGAGAARTACRSQRKQRMRRLNERHRMVAFFHSDLFGSGWLVLNNDLKDLITTASGTN